MQLLQGWDQYKVQAPGGAVPPNVYDEADAVYSAANYLKASGAPGDWSRAIFAYNHSSAYVQQVLSHAQSYYTQGLTTQGSRTSTTTSGSGARGRTDDVGGDDRPGDRARRVAALARLLRRPDADSCGARILCHLGVPVGAIRGVGRFSSAKEAAGGRVRHIGAKFWIERSDDARGAVLVLHGQLDLASAPELERCLREVMAQEHPSVLVYLNELSFVDSAGVSVLIRAKKQAEMSGRVLLLRRPTAQLHSVFAVVGLGEWVAFED
jgi:anti-anti-sigma factor